MEPASPRRFRRLATLRALPGVVIAAACVWFLWRFPWADASRAILQASAPLVLAALVVKIAAMFARAERTRVLVAHELTIGRTAFARLMFTRYAADNLVAGWAGIGVQLWMLVHRAKVRASSAVGALALEKYADTAMLLLGVEAVLHARLVRLAVTETAFATAIAMAIALLVGAIACGHLVPETRVGRLFQPAARAVRSWREAGRFAALTLLVWLLEAAVVALALRAASVSLGPLEVVLVAVAATLAFVVPGVPSGAGTVEAAMTTALGLVGVDPTRALTATLLFHALAVGPETIAGLVSLRGLGIRMRKLHNHTERPSLATPAA